MLRGGVVVVGVLSTAIAIVVQSIYGLYVMCSDLMYVVLFPQFTSVLFVPGTNPYGGLAGFFISLPLRILSGEQLVHLPPLIKYPWYDEEAGQGFPFRSLAMLSGFLAIVVVSRLTNAAHHRGWVSPRWDVLGYFSRQGAPQLHGMEVFVAKHTRSPHGEELNAKIELSEKVTEKLVESEVAQDDVVRVNDLQNGRSEHRDPLLNDKPVIHDHNV